MLTRANLDHLNKIAFVDYHLIYKAQTIIHLQLYSWGLVRRVEDFAPGTAIEYVPGVVHFPLEVLERYQKHNPWQAMLHKAEPATARALATRIRNSIWSVARGTQRFEAVRQAALKELLYAVSEMMQFSSIEEEFDLGGWLEPRLRDAALSPDVFLQLAQPQTTPYSIILLSRALRAKLDARFLPAFQRQAGFLRYPDLDGSEKPAHARDYMNSIGVGQSPEELQQTLRRFAQAADARAQGRAYALERICDHTLSLYPVALVYATLADHEEARHYWQMRVLRDLLQFATACGLDPAQTTLQQLNDHPHA